MAQFSALTGVSPRMIQHWIKKGCIRYRGRVACWQYVKYGDWSFHPKAQIVKIPPKRRGPGKKNK